MATYTENYGLHQWEANDNFLREDFNTDLAKIDTGLAEVAGKNCMVKLTELTTTAAASYVDVDLSGFDMSQFRCLEVYVENFSCTSSNSWLGLQINGDSNSVYYGSVNGTQFNCGTMTYAAQGGGYSCFTLSSSGQFLVMAGTNVSGYSSDYQPVTHSELYGFYKNGTFTGVKSLRLKDSGVNGVGSVINAGLHVAVYGLKR